MKVLVHGDTVRPGWPGGEPQVARTLVNALRMAGDTLTVSWNPSTESPAGYHPDRTDSRHHYAEWFRGYLSGVNPDAVVLFFDLDTTAIGVCTEMDIPVIVSAQIYWPVCPLLNLYVDNKPCPGPSPERCVYHMGGLFTSQTMPSLVKRAERLAQATAVVVPSQHMASTMPPLGNVHVIPNGLHTGGMDPLPWKGGKKTVCNVAGYEENRKGAGEYEWISRELKEVGAEFLPTKMRPREEHLALLRESYLAVSLPMWNEPLGYGAMEAMALGKPVVAYASGGVPEVVEDGVTGTLVPTGDRAALKQAVEDLLAADDVARMMGALGRRRVERVFSPEKMAVAYHKLMGGA